MYFLMRYINRTSRLSEMYRSKELKKYGLGGMHHTYILNICRHPGVSQEELANIIFVNKSNVTRQLTYLEKNGFIRREKSPDDGRKLLVFPTDKARELYPKISEMLKEWNKQLLDEFSEEEKERLDQQLEKIMLKAKDLMEIE